MSDNDIESELDLVETFVIESERERVSDNDFILILVVDNDSDSVNVSVSDFNLIFVTDTVGSFSGSDSARFTSTVGMSTSPIVDQ